MVLTATLKHNSNKSFAIFEAEVQKNFSVNKKAAEFKTWHFSRAN